MKTDNLFVKMLCFKPCMYVCMYACVCGACAHKGRCLGRIEDGIGVGVTGGCEQISVNAGNRSLDLWKNNVDS